MKPFILGACFLGAASAHAHEIRLYPGYITRIRCSGRLLVSSVGNESAIRLEAMPRELGCGVYLKPRVLAGQSNLLLETSAGTIQTLVSIVERSKPPRLNDLDYSLQGEAP